MFDHLDFNFDLDGDGVADSYAEAVDLDGDGTVDGLLIDVDTDGIADGILQPVDLDGDGIEDAYDYLSITDDEPIDWHDDFDDGSSFNDDSSVDFDGDGTPDGYIQEVDLDGDGTPDAIEYGIDTNNDGIIDKIVLEADTDHDGIADQLVESNDYDQDGVFDDAKSYIDTDHDGIFDEVSVEYDSNGDGVIDTTETYHDYDHDGNIDSATVEQLIDTDGDGVFDKYVISADSDGDNIFESTELYEYDADDGSLTLLAIDDSGAMSNLHGTYAEDLDNFDPEHTDPDDVVGHPEEAMRQWEYQGDTGRCALYSQKFVIEELTGEEVDIEEIADLAESHGWFSEESGTPTLNMDKVLEYYGIETDVSFHNTIDDLNDALAHDHKVIVSIDSGEIWYGENDSIFTPGEGADHAVEVIGIDYSDPDHPMVILNDSGNPDGCGEMVPIDTFADAWEDGANQMIVI